MSDDLRALIDEAVRSGRVTRVEPGVTSRPMRKKEDEPVRIRAEQCGCGGRVGRLPYLDQLDGSWPG